MLLGQNYGILVWKNDDEQQINFHCWVNNSFQNIISFIWVRHKKRVTDEKNIKKKAFKCQKGGRRGMTHLRAHVIPDFPF